MIDDIAGYRFENLVDAGIIKSRTDLARKQKESGFPLPVKLGKRQAWFPAREVKLWLTEQIAARPMATRPASQPVRVISSKSVKMTPRRASPPRKQRERDGSRAAQAE
jgi:hypothetical protein